MREKITRKEQAVNTKNKLVDTALKLFRDKGFDNVTINEICKEADVTTGAFYHHISSKAGVIVEAYSEYDEFFKEVVKSVDASKPYVDQIVDCLDYQVKYTEDLGVISTAVIYKIQISESNEFFLSKNRAIYSHINNLVKKAQENKELISDVSSEEITSELLIVIRGTVYNWCQSNNGYSLLDMERKIAKNYLKSYKTN